MSNPIYEVEDATLNDSDKTITTPTGSGYKVLYGDITFVTTSTAGTRQLEVHIVDANSNPVYKVSGPTQGLSATEDYILLPGGAHETSPTNNQVIVPLPRECVIPEGYSLRVFDSAAIDAAADDLTVRIVVEELVEL